MKGRQHMPSRKRDGNWFPMIPVQTQILRNDRNNQPAEVLCAKMPDKFLENITVNNKYHTFSRHDNRHAFETDGEYFGKGLGKRKFGSAVKEATDLLSWDHCSPMTSSYTTVFRIYKPPPPGEFRRFPSAYVKPKHGLAKLDTSTTCWFRESYKTPHAVLSMTQEPHLGPNSWRYSYKASHF